MAGKKTEAVEQGAEPRQVMAEPDGGWPDDEFTGKGGSFVRDPYTGKRSRADAPTETPPEAV